MNFGSNYPVSLGRMKMECAAFTALQYRLHFLVIYLVLK